MSDPPLLGYVVVESDYYADRDEPIHTFVSIPRASREQAEHDAERKREAYEKFCEEEGELYDEKKFSVQEIKIHPDRLERMGQDRWDTTMAAVGAVGEALVREDYGGGDV